MLRARTVGTMLCLGALVALPACSMFGGGDSGSGQYHQSSYPAYGNTSAQTAGVQQTAQPGTNVTREAAITPHMIRAVQRKLKEANLYSGRVDGVWGPMTQRGVQEWQHQHNQNATGQLDMATMQAMDVESGNSPQYGQGNGTNQPNYSTADHQQTGNSYSSAVPNNNMTPTPQTHQPTSNSSDNSANGPGAGSGNSGQPGH